MSVRLWRDRARSALLLSEAEPWRAIDHLRAASYCLGEAMYWERNGDGHTLLPPLMVDLGYKGSPREPPR